MIKQVICINWGTKYGAPYINRLYAMVARNITPPFTFTCFTDNRAGIHSDVLCEDLPDIDYEIPETRRGIWPKSRLWGAKLGSLSGAVLFLDLDLIITGSLDDFFTFGNPEDVILARNAAKPFERLGQTSVYRFPVGKLTPIQKKFAANPIQMAENYGYEQRFVTREAPGGIKFFPRKWIRHFRFQCLLPFPLNLVLPARLPAKTRIVIFPGEILPEDAILGGWSGRQGITLRQHLKAFVNYGARGKRPFQFLRHFMRPVKWVDDHWRE